MEVPHVFDRRRFLFLKIGRLGHFESEHNREDPDLRGSSSESPSSGEFGDSENGY